MKKILKFLKEKICDVARFLVIFSGMIRNSFQKSKMQEMGYKFKKSSGTIIPPSMDDIETYQKLKNTENTFLSILLFILLIIILIVMFKGINP